MNNQGLKSIINSQLETITYEIERTLDTDGTKNLAFDFPGLLQFALQTIMLQIWLNMMSSGLYDWAKGRILAKKELEAKKRVLDELATNRLVIPEQQYLSSQECLVRTKEVLRGAGLDEAQADLVAHKIIAVMKSTTPKEIN